MLIGAYRVDTRQYFIILNLMDFEYDYNADKNIKLKEERGISFDEIIYYINSGHLLDTVEHPNKEKYPGQHFYVVDVDGYVHIIPFVRQDKGVFLKTIIPSRKHTKKYLAQHKKQDDKNE